MIGERIKALRKQKRMTLEELAAALGTSKQTIHRYENGVIANIPHDKIVQLAQALDTLPADLCGWTRDEFSVSEVTDGAPVRIKTLPILGDIACGQPIYATESRENFAVADGSVDNGEIAAVIINDEATLKRVYFYPEQSKLILSPENPRYAPLVYLNDELDSIKILGKAVAFQSRIL